jgi:hypothetical protein
MDFWIKLKTGIKAKNTTQEWIAGKIDVPFKYIQKADDAENLPKH